MVLSRVVPRGVPESRPYSPHRADAGKGNRRLATNYDIFAERTAHRPSTRHQQPAPLLHLGVEPVDKGADARLRRDVAVEREPEAAADRLVEANAHQRVIVGGQEAGRSAENTAETQSLMRSPYAVFC